MSESALELIREAKEKHLVRLDLGNCGLTELPDELFELVWLEELILSSVWLEYSFLKNRFEKLKSTNKGDYNTFDSFNPSIKKLKKLKKLIACGEHPYGWRIGNLSFLKDLRNLEILSISDTYVSNISFLKNLRNLRRLDMWRCWVNDLTPMKDLNKLEQLSISYTDISDLTPIQGLKNLLILDIAIKYVEDLSPLKNLINLKVLDTSNSAVRDISPLKNLHKLQILDISHTNISDLTPLKDLSDLLSLNISHTDIANLSPINKLSKLERIDIGFTEVKDLRGIKEIIKKIPLIEGSFRRSLNNCIFYSSLSQFNSPPNHIVQRGNAAIIRYWQELENKETITNNQTKLIFVGNSRAGKTSLWQFLKYKIYTERADSTHGIKTEIWDTETLGTEDNQNLAVHIWDFGGQEYYHATHRLFLADNAVYLLVWENDSNKQGTHLEKFKLDDDYICEIEEVELEHFPASYWLDNIAYFAGRNCPILIVQNKMDSKSDFSPHTEGVSETVDCFHLSIKNAYERYNSGKTDYDFEKFKETLLELLRKNATAFKLVKYYAQVREALEKLSNKKEYISLHDLKKIAKKFDKTPDLENLLAYLKSFTNTVLYFPQNEVLNDRLYLNPTHISRDIYKILNRQVRENNGKFDMAHIKTRLNLNDDQEGERFVALMKEFDLIFEKQDEKGNREFVAPQYLSEKDKLSKDIQFFIKRIPFEATFSIQFKSFVPRSLMLRFIANNGVLSDGETYWRNGIIYESVETQQMIKVEYIHEKSTFVISVQNRAKQISDMRNIVHQFILLNNNDEDMNISNDGRVFINLRVILRLLHENVKGDIYDESGLIPLNEFNWLISESSLDMSFELLKEKISDLIGDAKTREAIENIRIWARNRNNGSLQNNMLLLLGQLTDLQKNKALGLLSDSEANLQFNKINFGVLNILNIEEPPN